MGWFSDSLFGEKKRIDKGKINSWMAPYNQMIDEQEGIAREMMNPNSNINRQQQQLIRSNQMDLVASQNQGLLQTASMGGVSSGQASMQARSNMNTGRAQMGQQYGMMLQNQFAGGMGLLQNVAGARQGEGERLANMHVQEVNASNAARQANQQMMVQMAGAAASAAGAAASDIALKENIELIDKSPSGINIYEFDYKNKSYGNGRYRGVMAQEVPNASYLNKDGYLWVDYNKLDVNFERIN